MVIGQLTERTLRTERLPRSVRHFSFQSLQAAVDFIRIFKNNHDSRTIIVGGRKSDQNGEQQKYEENSCYWHRPWYLGTLGAIQASILNDETLVGKMEKSEI